MAEPAAIPEREVAAVAPDGTPITLPASQVGNVETSGGRVMSPAEAKATRRDIDLQMKYGSGVGGVAEGLVMPPLMGAARGLSVGTSDEALLSAAEMLGGREGREAVRKRLADYQDFAPIASSAGEIGAIAAGSLVGDEAALARGPAAISRLGRALEGGAVRAFGESSGLARVAGRTVGGLASGATEGAIYAAGKTASDAAIHDEPLTGEKLVAGATHGALFGGGAGAALGFAGGAMSESLSGLRAPRSSGVAGEVGEAAPRGSIADQIEKSADVKTIKALGGSAGDLRRLEENVPGGFRRVAKDIREDIETSTGKSIGRHDRESLHEYATQRVEELGDKLGTMLEKLDTAGSGIAPNPMSFAQKVRKELVEPNLIMKAGGANANDATFTVMPGQEKAVEAVEKWVSNIEGAFSERAPTFKEWQKIRIGLDKELKYEAANVSPSVDALRKVRGMMEGELETAGEAAASSMGGSFQSEYQATKSLFQSVKKAEELTARGVSRELANNSVGLRATMGLMAGVASGTPITGALVGAGMKVVQDRGDMLAADLLSRVATLAGANRIAGRVTSELQKGVTSLIPGKATAADVAGLAPPARAAATPLGIAVTGDRRKDYAKLSGAIASAVANPLATTDRVSRSLGDLGDHAPATASAAISTTLNGLNFLASKLPPSRQDKFSLQPQFQTGTRASDAEISQFMRYSQAVDDPLIVLREAKANTLTRDHVEAVKTVYPQLYGEIQTQVMRSVIDSKSELPYARRIQLGILLDIPTDKTLAPDFLRAIQATFSSAEKAGAESPPSNAGAPPQIASTVQTATQQAVERAG